MSTQFDPEGCYDVRDPEHIKTGEIKKGLYYEGDWQVGRVEGYRFIYNESPAGRLDGFTLIRTDPEPLTRFTLVPKE